MPRKSSKLQNINVSRSKKRKSSKSKDFLTKGKMKSGNNREIFRFRRFGDYSIKKGGNGDFLSNFKIMVFGGGDPKLYRSEYFVIGDHPSANFGHDLDWNNPDFWYFLNIILTSETNESKKFDAIIIDNGTESWLGRIDFCSFCKIIREHISPNGIVIVRGPWSHGDQEPNIVIRYLLEFSFGFKALRKVGFGKVVDENISTIFSLLDIETVSSLIDITTDTNDPDMDNGRWNSEKMYIEVNKDFKYVKEYDQIEFLNKRLLNKYAESKDDE